VNVAAVQTAVRSFIARHRVAFDRVASRETQLLEIAALAVVAEHYRAHGYAVVPRNLVDGEFKVKLGSRGRIENFSWFEAIDVDARFEIHANLPVQSSFTADEGIYVVDVGVVRAGRAIGEYRRNPKTGKGSQYVRNDDLVTFAEVKKLVAYPMLLAQFVGIVHEIKPSFIGGGRRPRRFVRDRHFDPALLTLGHLHANGQGISDGFARRGFRLRILTSLDHRVAQLAGSSLPSSLLDPD
jgi:hypothetical protein